MDLGDFFSEFQLDPAIRFGIIEIPILEPLRVVEQYLELEFQVTLLENPELTEIENTGQAPISSVDQPSTRLLPPKWLLDRQKVATTLQALEPHVEYKSSGWTCVNPPQIKLSAKSQTKTRRQRSDEYLALVDMTSPSKERVFVIL